MQDKKNILIELRYTFSFAARFSAMVFAGFAALGLTLFFVLNRRLGIDYFSDILTLNRLEEKLPLIIFATAVIQAVALSLIFFFLSLYWGHAVAGPVLRFRRFLTMINQGEKQTPMSFRKNDQLHYLAEIFRKVQLANQKRHEQWLGCLKTAEKLIEEYDLLERDKNAAARQMEEKRLALKDIYQKMQGLFTKENK